MTWPHPEVIDALKRAGLPIPSPERIRSMGYSAREVQAIERARRQAAKTNDPEHSS